MTRIIQFIRGYASLADPFGTNIYRELSQCYQSNDTRALAEDWAKIGMDLRIATNQQIEKLEQTQKDKIKAISTKTKATTTIH